MAFVRIDKLPLPVKKRQASSSMRCSGPNALALCGQGARPEAIDAALVAFSMPIGPWNWSIRWAWISRGGGRRWPATRRWQTRRASWSDFTALAKLGAKSGEGFYRWVDGRRKKLQLDQFQRASPKRHHRANARGRRAAALPKGVVADADLADAGVIFGTGFAPFTGGPMNYLRGRDAGAQSTSPARSNQRRSLKHAGGRNMSKWRTGLPDDKRWCCG